MSNVSDKIYREHQNTFYIQSFVSENYVIYEITWKNMLKPYRPQMHNIIPRMRLECWITKATNTHSEYVYVLLFHGSNGYAKGSQCYVIRTLSVLLIYTGSVISSVLSREEGFCNMKFKIFANCLKNWQ